MVENANMKIMKSDRKMESSQPLTRAFILWQQRVLMQP
jgi:hypothetical protein